jgi:hypothetical protein
LFPKNGQDGSKLFARLRRGAQRVVSRAVSTRSQTALALAAALAFGCALGSAITFLALRSDRHAIGAAASNEQIRLRATEILNGKDPLRRVTELDALLSTLDPAAVPVLLQALDAAPVGGGDPELVLFAMWWAQFDPQAAYTWTVTEPRAQYGSVIAAIIRSWAHKDPKSALGTAQGLVFPAQREMAIDAAVAGWDESGAPGLLEIVERLNDIEKQRLAGSVARRRVLALGPAEAFRWVESLGTSESVKEMMALRVASAAAESVGGGPIAAAWAAPRVRSDDRLSGFPRRIATRWVIRDPEAAMAWLAQLPAGADRSDGVTEAFRTWAGRDQHAAFTWIEKAEIQPWNEPALAVYTRAIAKERPKDAIELAQRISDQELRDGTTIVVGQVWAQQDRDAAQAWFAQADVTERVRRVSMMVGKAPKEQRPPIELHETDGS